MLPLFFSAYFFPRKVALGLVTVLVLIAAAPLVYEPASRDSGYPALVLGIAAAWYTLTLVIFALKSRLVEAERVQREMAVRDALTGLGNRRAFDAAPARGGDAGRGDRARPRPRASALLFVDLDRFKEINDSYGHSAGDRLLRAVAARCSAVLRPSDTLARIGGDEFAVVAPRAGREGAERMAEDLKSAVESAWQAGDADPMTATVSFALLGEDGHTAAALMRAADRRLHDASAPASPHARPLSICWRLTGVRTPSTLQQIHRRRLTALAAIALVAATAGLLLGASRDDSEPERKAPRSAKRPRRRALPLERRVGELLVMSFDGATAPGYIRRRLRSGQGIGRDPVRQERPRRGLAAIPDRARSRRGARRGAGGHRPGGRRHPHVPFARARASRRPGWDARGRGRGRPRRRPRARAGGVNVNLAPVADVADSLALGGGRAGVPGRRGAGGRADRGGCHARARAGAGGRHRQALSRAGARHRQHRRHVRDRPRHARRAEGTRPAAVQRRDRAPTPRSS